MMNAINFIDGLDGLLAGLTAIGQVLRHQDLATTALYAKVDLNTLRGVAQPWPTSVPR